VDAIGGLEKEFKKSTEEERLTRRPDDRNIFARTDDFISGAEYFAVTQRSLDNFLKALASQSLDPNLTNALKDIMSLPPQRKSRFLESLRIRVKQTGNQTALQELKTFEKKILIYFKLPS
jgi:hypothetical protein